MRRGLRQQDGAAVGVEMVNIFPISVNVVLEVPRQRELVAREQLNPELLPLGAHQRKERDYG